VNERASSGSADSTEPERGYGPAARDPPATDPRSRPSGSDPKESLRTYLRENEADLEAIVEGNYAVSPIVKALLVRHERGKI
jgi:hypothetical protein